MITYNLESVCHRNWRKNKLRRFKDEITVSIMSLIRLSLYAIFNLYVDFSYWNTSYTETNIILIININIPWFGLIIIRRDKSTYYRNKRYYAFMKITFSFKAKSPWLREILSYNPKKIFDSLSQARRSLN